MSDHDKLTEALLAQVEAGAGRTFDEQERERLERVIGERVEQADKLREVELTNADEPFTTFRAYREEG